MIPNFQTKCFFLIIISIVALSLTAAVPNKGPSDPWRGTWWSIDPFDNSLQKVVFTGGGLGKFNFIDWGASVCGKDVNGNPIYAAQASGNAVTVDATSFNGVAPLICKTHPPSIWDPSFPFTWTYDAQNDTLSGFSATWTRSHP